MSHYDCSDCGAFRGISFGYCKNCTPQEYFDIKEELKDIIYETEIKVNKHFRKQRDKLYSEILNETDYTKLQERLKELENEKIHSR